MNCDTVNEINKIDDEFKRFIGAEIAMRVINVIGQPRNGVPGLRAELDTAVTAKQRKEKPQKKQFFES